MVDLLAYFEMDGVVAEEFALIPGLDALFLLTRILREVESGEYDFVVIDCPPYRRDTAPVDPDRFRRQ